MEKVEKGIGGRTVTVYDTGARGVPTVYASMYVEAGAEVIAECTRMGCGGFNLVSVSGLDWDVDLSPWESSPVVSQDDHFTGGAEAYAGYLVDEVVPFAEGILGGSERILAGYSMGGLFALYAPHVTDAFSRCVSASGSVWFPGFEDFVRSTVFRRMPGSVYLSIGDRESRTKNPYLRETESITRRLCDFYASKGAESVFELNPGNHFRDAALRLAKGIAWTLSRRGGL